MKDRLELEQAYEERKDRAMALEGQQVELLKGVTEEGSKQLPWKNQRIVVNGFTFTYFAPPEKDKWEEGQPIRFIDDKEEFVISLGWKTDEHPWVPDTIVQVEELKGRGKGGYRSDFIDARNERRREQKKQTAQVLRKAHS